MCGRYQLLRPNDITTRFQTTSLFSELFPNADVRPTEMVPVVAADRVLILMRWGLRTTWSDKPLINARAEGIERKATFAEPLRLQRCIFPATGFYEWQAVPGAKKAKILFTRDDGEMFGLAGIWDTYRDSAGQERQACVIITTTPNAIVAPVHNRMPAILRREDEAAWLNPDETEPERLLRLLRPLPDDELRAIAV
ncbi:MAG TPA: SOS response-associated peptidase [Ktedonobacterales bacterium]